MEDNLRGQKCPVCSEVDFLRVLASQQAVVCLACHQVFAFNETHTEPSPDFYTPPFLFEEEEEPSEVVDFLTTIDLRGNVKREEVSRYVIEDNPAPVLHFDPTSPHAEWVMHRQQKSIRNRRRYNRDLIRRAKSR